MELNRRDFLKGALAVGAVSAAGAGLAACAPAGKDNPQTAETGGIEYPAGLQESDFKESPVELAPITEFADEKTYDVVVVGAGTGGVPAALSALEEGATVAVLQKESKAIAQGGTCSGVLLDESDEQGVMNYIQGFLEDCGWRADRKLAETYCKYSGEAIRWTQVRTAEAGFPPYTVRPTAVTEYEDGSKCSRRSIMFGPKPFNNGTMVEHLAELAGKLGIPADALKKSVERYNELVDAGFDADFGKQAKYLRKVEKAPFWGIHKHVRVSALCAGATVNENYQATRTDGEAIPNLWITGFSAGQLCGAPDWSMYQGGMSAGHCIMTGRICGIQAATGGKLEAATPITEADVVAVSA